MNDKLYKAKEYSYQCTETLYLQSIDLINNDNMIVMVEDTDVTESGDLGYKRVRLPVRKKYNAYLLILQFLLVSFFDLS